MAGVLDVPSAHSARRADSERFVAFAFAGADMVIETDTAGCITFAAGAFRSRFGQSAETFIGKALQDLVSPMDRPALVAALALLAETGRLPPLMIRLADAKRSRLALGGMVLPTPGRPARLCLSLARAPMPLANAVRTSGPHALAREAEARMREGQVGSIGLLEITGDNGALLQAGDAVGQVLESIAPDTIANEVAMGRFGLLGADGSPLDLDKVAKSLEGLLQSRGHTVAVRSDALPLEAEGLTAVQATRALRQALNVFARQGAGALGDAGFTRGLAGYIEQAAQQSSSLRGAIRSNNFGMAFQPIVSLADRSTHHYEALIRLREMPGHNFASPQDFIMVIEALGLADELDLAVAQQACDAASRTGRHVALNLSGQSVQSAPFRERLMRLLAAAPACKAGLVMVEMTETAEIEDVAEAARTAEALRSVGVAFCLDDFGAGAADIRLLRSLVPDIVKLDGSYIPGVAEDGQERAFVSGMVEIARAAKAEIVAERVETESEAAALLSLGVQYGQGWLFGKPAGLPEREPARVARRSGQKDGWG